MKKSLLTGVALVLALGMAGGAYAQHSQRGVLNLSVPFGLHGISWHQARVGIAYESDNINASNQVRGVGAELYTLPFDGFKLGSTLYGVLGNRTAQSLLGVGYSQLNGMNAQVALRGDFLRVGAEYSLKKGLEGNFGTTSFTKLPKNNTNNSYTCPPNSHPVGNGQCDEN